MKTKIRVSQNQSQRSCNLYKCHWAKAVISTASRENVLHNTYGQRSSEKLVHARSLLRASIIRTRVSMNWRLLIQKILQLLDKLIWSRKTDFFAMRLIYWTETASRLGWLSACMYYTDRYPVSTARWRHTPSWQAWNQPDLDAAVSVQ